MDKFKLLTDYHCKIIFLKKLIRSIDTDAFSKV